MIGHAGLAEQHRAVGAQSPVLAIQSLPQDRGDEMLAPIHGGGGQQPQCLAAVRGRKVPFAHRPQRGPVRLRTGVFKELLGGHVVPLAVLIEHLVGQRAQEPGRGVGRGGVAALAFRVWKEGGFLGGHEQVKGLLSLIVTLLLSPLRDLPQPIMNRPIYVDKLHCADRFAFGAARRVFLPARKGCKKKQRTDGPRCERRRTALSRKLPIRARGPARQAGPT
ncbi:MAG: hypothetical protein ABR915_24050 [Thermoguttaceae bacterium]